MLGDVLRLSWSISLGSLLPSSLRLRPSKLSRSEGDCGRGSSCSVLVFFGALVSSLSLSEISSLRPCLLTFGVEASSTRAFLAVCLDFSALPSLLDVLTPPGEARPLDLSSSRGPGASFFRPLLIDIESLFCRVFILQAVETPFSSAWAAEYKNFSASPQVPHSCGLGSRKQDLQVSSVGTWNLQDLSSAKPGCSSGRLAGSERDSGLRRLRGAAAAAPPPPSPLPGFSRRRDGGGGGSDPPGGRPPSPYFPPLGPDRSPAPRSKSRPPLSLGPSPGPPPPSAARNAEAAPPPPPPRRSPPRPGRPFARLCPPPPAPARRSPHSRGPGPLGGLRPRPPPCPGRRPPRPLLAPPRGQRSP